ncbi:hypothetical protein JRQ81_001490 [Phrynocephalus forsythii]|uniref:N(6)-L-threonylcarbamoyladenine synthase n=1 Tax=Phrynocephalus forsythii TaxID=171643 RepID=A0A9Q1B922_9SAUR|nr:hypothetical protein JRQ81_001490 [Phrynocephalus forsythii]
MNVGVAHSEVNPNTRVMNSRGMWLTYALGVGLLHIVLLSIPFFSVPVAWTLTNVIHNLGMYVFLHAVKGTPFETPDQGKARLLTHWEQLDYGVQCTSSRKFFTISPIILYFLASFYTKYDPTHFILNTASLLSVLIPKLPQLHGDFLSSKRVVPAHVAGTPFPGKVAAVAGGSGGCLGTCEEPPRPAEVWGKAARWVESGHPSLGGARRSQAGLSVQVEEDDGARAGHAQRHPLRDTWVGCQVETSCDDTGAAVLDEEGNILGEALHCQNAVHLETGGIVPVVAQQLHRENIAQIVQEALSASGVRMEELSAVATTVKPGIGLSLGIGLAYGLELAKKYKKPFIPIHHMEAHALTIRLIHPVEFPFLVLLLSGGHGILAVARGISDFLLLGQTLDSAPGDVLDKLSQRLSLRKHPECSTLSGGQAIERMAQRGNRRRYTFTIPMEKIRSCNFSFSGLQSHITRVIEREKEAEGQLLSSASDLAAAIQHALTVHIANRTHRAILFCREAGLLPQTKAALVVSGGVASNQYIRKALQAVGEATGVTLLCPPPRLCTDNGVMIAWNGIEKLRAGLDVLHNVEDMRYEPKAPLGIDISKQVTEASIKVPELNLTI